MLGQHLFQNQRKSYLEKYKKSFRSIGFSILCLGLQIDPRSCSFHYCYEENRDSKEITPESGAINSSRKENIEK